VPALWTCVHGYLYANVAAFVERKSRGKNLGVSTQTLYCKTQDFYGRRLREGSHDVNAKKIRIGSFLSRLPN
jgi:hypothetical protein